LLYYPFHLSRSVEAGAFGQNQQQPPQTNPMFGNLSAPAANPAPSGGFGALTAFLSLVII
jgi:hypothetical protein